MKYFCNPINVNYRYQFNADPRQHGRLQICREAADPSMILFKGRYYIFASMTLGVWVSDDMAHWENHRLPEGLPFYDYAPDVRVLGDWVYFCASSRDHNCDRWRTQDVLNGPYERIEGSFPFWDPNLFRDDDGRVYFYWGCSNVTPIYGVELDGETMNPKTEPKALVEGHPFEIGYERVGENNSLLPASEEEIDAKYKAFHEAQGIPESMVPEEVKPLIRGMFSNRPYIEGAWMDKHNGKYYLQYACPRRPVQHLFRRRLCVRQSARRLYARRKQPLFLQARRLPARRGPRLHHDRSCGQPLAHGHHAHLQKS